MLGGDNFRGAEICVSALAGFLRVDDLGAPGTGAFDANQYSFFGDGGLGGLGGLEEGLDAPPEEEGLGGAPYLPDEFDAKFTFNDSELVVDEEEDLSIASMLLNQSRLEQQRERALEEMMEMMAPQRSKPVVGSAMESVDPFQGLVPLPADMLDSNAGIELELLSSSAPPGPSIGMPSSLARAPMPPVGGPPHMAGQAPPSTPPGYYHQPTTLTGLTAEELEQQLLGKANESGKLSNPLIPLLGGLQQPSSSQGMGMGQRQHGLGGQHQQGIDFGFHGPPTMGQQQPPSLPPPPLQPPMSMPVHAHAPPPPYQMQPHHQHLGGRPPPPGHGHGPPGPPYPDPMGPPGMPPFFHGPPGAAPPPGQRLPPPSNGYFFPSNAGPPHPSMHPPQHPAWAHPNNRPPPPHHPHGHPPGPSFNHGGPTFPPHGGPGAPNMHGPTPPNGHFNDPYGRPMQPYNFNNTNNTNNNNFNNNNNNNNGPQQQQQQQHGHAAPPLAPDAYQQFQRQQNMHSYKQQPSGWVGVGGHQHPQGPNRRKVQDGVLMHGDEIETIMSIMYSAVHTGLPYTKDYYYLALVNSRHHERNAASFRPEFLRDLSEAVAKLDPTRSAKFAPIEGLGKVVISNILTPRVLLDLGRSSDPESSNQGDQGSDRTGLPVKPLEQEPLLAARMMVEDCMNLLLDIDDIDRIFAAAAALAVGNAPPRLPPSLSPKDLRLRRVMLLTGIAESFRLPDSPTGSMPLSDQASESSAKSERNDGVFLRIMALPKGRSLLARTLRLLEPSPVQAMAVDEESPSWMDDSSDVSGAHDQQAASSSPLKQPLHLLWAVLRSSLPIFDSFGAAFSTGSSSAADASLCLKTMVDATSRLAAASSLAISRLHHPEKVLDCMCALVASLEARWLQCHKNEEGFDPTEFIKGVKFSPLDVLPLANMREDAASSSSAPVQRQDWLGEVVAALVSRGEQLGLVASSSSLGRGKAVVSVEVQTAWDSAIQKLFAALSRHLNGLLSLPSEGAAHARKLVCQPLLRAMAGQASDEQRITLRQATQGLNAQ